MVNSFQVYVHLADDYTRQMLWELVATDFPPVKYYDADDIETIIWDDTEILND